MNTELSSGAVSADGLSEEEIERLKAMEAESRDLGADDYMELTEAQEGTFQLRAEEAVVMRRLAPKPSDRVLDAGAGVGRFTLLLAPRVKKVVAVDLSKRCLERVQAEAKSRGLSNVETIQSDLCSYEVEAGSFDKVLCLEVLQHVPSDKERLRAVERMFRALRPGGRIVVSGVASNRRATGEKEGIRGEGPGALYFFSFTPDDMASLLRRAGFGDVRVDGLIVLPRRLTRRLPIALTRLEVLASRLPRSAELGAFVLATATKR